MVIPHHGLSRDTLNGVIEEYVTRDGTELSDAACKREEVQRLLDSGALILVFDPVSESCNIVSPSQLAEAEVEIALRASEHRPD